MRGEHAWAGNLTMSNAGSSPHARGTLCRSLEEVRDTRFIPACAGNTPIVGQANYSSSVHPRMRGEHSVVNWRRHVDIGSSPHARGTRRHKRPSMITLRFIPACAGNTRRMAMSTVVCSVHPRMRGEHDRANVNLFCRHGSSPHARGTLGVGQAVCVVCAVHPRMRGEHFNGESLL